MVSSDARPPAVAGLFYPAPTERLRAEVTQMIDMASSRRAHIPRPKALIVPRLQALDVHSGPIAASAYALVAMEPKPTHIVLLGPAHAVGFEGIALPQAQSFRTPLGTVPVDSKRVERVRSLNGVVESAKVHEREHSMEVQLPFLQVAMGEHPFSVLPLAVGQTSAEEVEQVIEAVWGGDETLIVISSDLSHYLPYGVAVQLDGETALRIAAFDSALPNQMRLVDLAPSMVYSASPDEKPWACTNSTFEIPATLPETAVEWSGTALSPSRKPKVERRSLEEV